MFFDNKTFLVKEQVQFLKLAGTYDIFDPVTGVQIGVAKEEPAGWVKFLKLFVNKLLLPTHISVYDAANTKVLSIAKPFSFWRAKVQIFNEYDVSLGYFKSKILTIGGGFWVYDTSDNQVAEIKGNWVGWNFKFLDSAGNELGYVTKKWAGAVKEIFTSADNYIIELNENIATNKDTAALLLAAGLAIDTIYKEKK